ncbi:hypothetical protein MMC11_007426 [Xylographa trunciseda]|nr:hypothetical protein [Xylographa trunciseda]
MAAASGVFDYYSNLTFTVKSNVPMVLEYRSPFKPGLDDPPVTSELVSNIKSLAQKTEEVLKTFRNPPTGPARFHGAAWYGFAALALLLILMTGLLAGLTLAVMSVDMTRLRVWTKTGSLKRQGQASSVLGLRQHPNWLLTSFILSSIAVGQALPLITNHLFTPGAVLPFVVSTILLTFIGSLLPQAIMPLYTLMIASHMVWFITILMWLTAPLSVPLGIVFRWCKILGKRKEEWRSDGILGSEELAEFVRLHQIDAGLGGELSNNVGEMVRDIIKGEVGAVGEIAGWDLLFKTYGDEEVDTALLECNVRETKIVDPPVFIRDLPVHSIPIVRQDCSLMALADWLTGDDERVAIVVHSNDLINCDANGLSWSPGGPHGDPPMGPITSTPISPLGIITSHYFLRRLFLGVNDIRKLGQYTQTSWAKSTDKYIGPDRNVPMPTHGSPPSTESFPAHGLRKRSNTLKNVSAENPEKLYNSTPPRSTLVHGTRFQDYSRFDGLAEDERVGSQPEPVGSLLSNVVSESTSSPSEITFSIQTNPLANITNSFIVRPAETPSSCYSTNNKTSFHSNLEDRDSETQSQTCDDRPVAHSEHIFSRRQSVPSQRPGTLDTDAAYTIPCGLPALSTWTAQQMNSTRISSSPSICNVYREVRCTRLGRLTTAQMTPLYQWEERRHKSLTDLDDDGRTIQLLQVTQRKGKVREELTRNADKRHESLTDPQEDEDVKDIIKRAKREEEREGATRKSSQNGEERFAPSED